MNHKYTHWHYKRDEFLGIFAFEIGFVWVCLGLFWVCLGLFWVCFWGSEGVVYFHNPLP